MDITQAEILTGELMAKHGLLAKGWTWNWDSALSRMGCCWCRRKKIPRNLQPLRR